jgi:predicted RNA-binding protein with PIN domain
MALLIDGYNLLHVTDIFGSPRASETALHASRQALLAFLAAVLDAKTRSETTIVFDAAGAPPGLPTVLNHEGITVHFARRYASADELLEELIEDFRSPRSLTVVSSDHRVQRAARRRGAAFADSDRWFAEIKASHAKSDRTTTPAAKPVGQLPPDQVEYWLREFTPTDAASTPDPSEALDAKGEAKSREDAIFPPGYAEDLLEETD